VRVRARVRVRVRVRARVRVGVRVGVRARVRARLARGGRAARLGSLGQQLLEHVGLVLELEAAQLTQLLAVEADLVRLRLSGQGRGQGQG
jgi:hypothetical protein